jgi:hypothetical protein
LEDKGVDERIILKGILWKQDGGTEVAFIWIRIWTIFRLL